jgi:hypothetical protein
MLLKVETSQTGNHLETEIPHTEISLETETPHTEVSPEKETLEQPITIRGDLETLQPPEGGQIMNPVKPKSAIIPPPNLLRRISSPSCSML